MTRRSSCRPVPQPTWRWRRGQDLLLLLQHGGNLLHKHNLGVLAVGWLGLGSFDVGRLLGEANAEAANMRHDLDLGNSMGIGRAGD